ncbi:MAG: hypothetical protein IKE77_05970 [Erysipelotrichaceae bacterium]|nr:hypothetical protein [Erysipelotrichaceae bacterium]
MNRLIASESIDYQYKYYKQALYRKYKREGIDGAVAFFMVILEDNPLIFRILKKQYRYLLNDEQNDYLNGRFEEVLSSHNDTEDPQILALYTMAALYDRNSQAADIVRHAAMNSNNNRTFMAKYNEEASKLQELSFLSPMNAVQFLLYKYIFFNHRNIYDDAYYSEMTIIINPKLENKPLKKLFEKRMENRDFKYLCLVIKSLQNTTLEAAGVDEEVLFETCKKIKGLKFTHYVTFCISMFLRKSNDKVQQLKDLEYCCSRLKKVLKNRRKASYYADYLKMLHSILLDEKNASQYIENYKFRELDHSDCHDGDNRKWTEDVFDLLLSEYPELVLPFIRKRGVNNSYVFEKNRDYEFARRRTMTLCADWIKMLKKHYNTRQCIEIFMNSLLRSCYPLTLFLKDLLSCEKREDVEKTDEEYCRRGLQKLFKDYECTGIVYRPENSQRYELTAYSFRNDNSLIVLPAALANAAESMKFKTEKIKNQNVLISYPIRFTLKSIRFVNNEREIHRLVVSLPEKYKVNRFRKARKYSAYI